ncbi:MAG: hypothetical protein EOO96_06310 [Pedobacter sp.]|nr:MAG: hypothetical protein EOO96_06310 [Pedobacter sp.]
MEISVTHSDLQQFIEKFEPNKFKLIKNGMEVRGLIDLPRAIIEAKAVIEKFQLKLVVLHNAEMLSYKGFEVNYLVG